MNGISWRKLFMKHLFFVLLFALTALFFTACSSGGSGGGSSNPSLPSIEDTFPQLGDLPDTTPVPSSFGSEHSKEYKVANQTVIDNYIDALSALTWLTCDPDYSYCDGTDTESSPNYDAQISGYESYGEYFIDIRLYGDVFIEDTLFTNLPPVNGSIESDDMNFNYTFAANADAEDYKDAYIELLEARGFTGDPSYPGGYMKNLSGGYAAYFEYYLYNENLYLFTEVYKKGIEEPAAAAYAYTDVWGSLDGSQKDSYIADLSTANFTYNAEKGLYEKSIGEASLTVSIDEPFSASLGGFYITWTTSASDGNIIYDYDDEFPDITASLLGNRYDTIYEGNASEWFALQADHHIYDGYTHDVINGGVNRYCIDGGYDMYCYEYKVESGVYSVSEGYTEKTFWELLEAEEGR
jgi:hypothetical protein